MRRIMKKIVRTFRQASWEVLGMASVGVGAATSLACVTLIPSAPSATVGGLLGFMCLATLVPNGYAAKHLLKSAKDVVGTPRKGTGLKGIGRALVQNGVGSAALDWFFPAVLGGVAVNNLANGNVDEAGIQAMGAVALINRPFADAVSRLRAAQKPALAAQPI
jgi:hypothetical protein